MFLCVLVLAPVAAVFALTSAPASTASTAATASQKPTSGPAPAAEDDLRSLVELVRQQAKPMRVVPGTLFKRLPPPPPPPEKPEKKADPAKSETEEAVPTAAPFDIRIGTFNVLGSQHTTPSGDRQNYPPASVRSAGAARLIAKHGVQILGTQELQDDQLRSLQSRTGMAAYPGFAWGTLETDNSILYNPSLYEFVSGSKYTITFVGRPRPQPILRLRHRATGREFYVINTHPSPGGGRALVERRNAQAATVSMIKQLRATGLPVLTTGDMNDRAEFYCHVVAPAGMSAPNGGSAVGGCRPPPMPMPVDWVVGGGVTWSSYWRDMTSTAQRISDHIFVSALAHVE